LGAVAYLLILRPPKEWLKKQFGNLHIVKGGLLFTAIAAPWYVAVGLATKWLFLKVFFLFENVGRFAGHTNHIRPQFWYYLPVLGYGFSPWVLLLPGSVKQAFDSRRDAFADTAEGRRSNAMLLFGLWAAAIFVFFSASITKLETYIPPAFTALAALVGLAADRWFTQAEEGTLPRSLAVTSYILGSLAIGFIIAGIAAPF